MRRSKPGSPDQNRFGAAGTALVLACAAFVLLGADYFPPWLRTVAVFGLLLLSGAFLLASPWSRRLAWRTACRLLFFWVHSDQTKVTAEYPHYPGVLKDHRRRLGFSLRDIAKRAGISYPAVCLFARFPDLIPRPDYLERLCEALLLPTDYLRHGGSYGPEHSYARLLRYDDLGYGKVFTWERVRGASQEELDEILARIEDLRQEDLKKEGKVS